MRPTLHSFAPDFVHVTRDSAAGEILPITMNGALLAGVRCEAINVSTDRKAGSASVLVSMRVPGQASALYEDFSVDDALAFAAAIFRACQSAVRQ